MATLTPNLNDTIVALATPPGQGAIGVIRLSGKEAIEIVDKVFPGKDLSNIIMIGSSEETMEPSLILKERGKTKGKIRVTRHASANSLNYRFVSTLSCCSLGD